MIEERIQYGIDNFLEDNFFLPFSNSYCLEEKSETGRSKLHVDVRGDNLCSEDYDHKGKCNFLKKESPFKLRRSVDNVLLQKKEEKWILHLIEISAASVLCQKNRSTNSCITQHSYADCQRQEMQV